MASISPSRFGASGALDLLTQEHRQLEQLFTEYAMQRNGDRDRLIETVCAALSAHTQLEESLFYPAIQDALDSNNLVEEAKVEHDTVKQLASKLQSGLLDDAARDATFTVMAQMVLRHMQHEERQLFPLAKHASVDLDALGRKMADEKRRLEQHPVLTRGQQPQTIAAGEHPG